MTVILSFPHPFLPLCIHHHCSYRLYQRNSDFIMYLSEYFKCLSYFKPSSCSYGRNNPYRSCVISSYSFLFSPILIFLLPLMFAFFILFPLHGSLYLLTFIFKYFPNCLLIMTYLLLYISLFHSCVNKHKISVYKCVFTE